MLPAMVRPAARLALALALAVPGAPLPAAARPASWLTGNPADATPARTRPGLLLAGGGGDVEAAWRWFVDCAGGGDIVVLRASGADGYNDYLHRRIGGIDSVETLLFRNVEETRDPAALAVIARAEGLFLAGGDQARYVAWWKDGPVGAALNAHLRAGKPLGGSSAGLAVLGQYYFPALRDTVTSDAALRDPFAPAVTLGTGFIAAPPLAGIITDSHFSARQRLGRLVVFLARLRADGAPTPLAGLGIDEATALCVEPDGVGTVFTERAGRVWLVEAAAAPRRLAPGQPLEQSGVRVTGIGPGSRLDLPARRVDGPALRQVFTAEEGRMKETPP
jgi:cyanophycinase